MSQIIYSRLTILKKSAVTLSIPPIPQQITPSHVPSLSLSNSVIAGSGAPPAHYYQRALGLCERWFDGDIDQPAFEEGMRHMFGTQGYILFTMDKLLHGVMRQVRLLPLSLGNHTDEFRNRSLKPASPTLVLKTSSTSSPQIAPTLTVLQPLSRRSTAPNPSP